MDGAGTGRTNARSERRLTCKASQVKQLLVIRKSSVQMPCMCILRHTECGGTCLERGSDYDTVHRISKCHVCS